MIYRLEERCLTNATAYPFAAYYRRLTRPDLFIDGAPVAVKEI